MGIADSSRFAKYLEPKFGWGHESFKEDLVTQIEALKFDHSWRPDEVRNAIVKVIKDSKR
jgi:hypothetical protein